MGLAQVDKLPGHLDLQPEAIMPRPLRLGDQWRQQIQRQPGFAGAADQRDQSDA